MKQLSPLLLFVIVSSIAHAHARLPAFPSAEGFGGDTPGGRGGRVIHVTTIEDNDSPGTLRYALTSKGPRIVVFDVGGTIRLKKALHVEGEERSYLTIAGQTAPGGGVCISNASLIFSGGVHDVVLRYLHIRTGDQGPDREPDALGINSVYNMIVDHCSVSWGVDECLSITAFPKQQGDAHDITVQWCIVSEGLNRSTHSKGAHSKGLMVAYGPTRITLHHNLIMHCYDRNPYLPTEGEFPYIVDVVNNVVYNWGNAAGIGYQKTNHNGCINFVGNYYIAGPSSRPRPCLTMGVNAKIYARGNIGPTRTSRDEDEWKAVSWNPKELRPGLKAPERFDAPPVATYSYEETYHRVLADAGATRPQRDAVDTRLIREVNTGAGRIIDHPSDVGGWPVLDKGVPPKDSDQDGMPDGWETAQGLNPHDAADANADRDKDGYTNIEEYLNSLVANDPREP
ncbi:MAG: pectate lyase [Planctomycetota bacterium]